MRTHLNILAVLYLLTSVGEVLTGLAIIGIAGIGGALSGDMFVWSMVAGFGSIIGAFLIMIGLPAIFLAYGLWKLRWWARPLGFVLAILNILNPPLGTILGIYTLWVLWKPEVRDLLERRDGAPIPAPGHAGH